MIYSLFQFFSFDITFRKINTFLQRVKLKRVERISGQKVKFVSQGSGGVSILGDLKSFKFHKSSHLKSNTVIECSGGVYIGKEFHPGRGLTIFSVNHNYQHPKKLPYDEKMIKESVIIEDFVWAGANVTIVPGVKIGSCAVLGAGSVVTKNVPPFAVVGGNPAKVIKMRDVEYLKGLMDSDKKE
jgi:acetyltransferase-like isoleucine patch superfamily enzyme